MAILCSIIVCELCCVRGDDTSCYILQSEECPRGSVSFPGNNIVEQVVDDMEYDDDDDDDDDDGHWCRCCQQCRRCYTRRINTILHPCCDVYLCARCARHLMTTERPCPRCNQPIRGISPAKLPKVL